MSFTDGKVHIATEECCKAPWGGAKNGRRFRCYLCGHRFKPGDSFRWQYTNDIPNAGGNPLVCMQCDGPDVRERWQKHCREARDRFWWFREET